MDTECSRVLQSTPECSRAVQTIIHYPWIHYPLLSIIHYPLSIAVHYPFSIFHFPGRDGQVLQARVVAGGQARPYFLLRPVRPPEIVFVKSPARSGPEKVRPGPPEAREKLCSCITTPYSSKYGGGSWWVTVSQ